MADLAVLQRFAIPGTLALDAGCGGLPRLSVATPLCRAELYLHGAHITAWQPAGQPPVIWMSSLSWFAAGKPIRGGIPVCWPWFGTSTTAGLPLHGCARLQPWSLISTSLSADGNVEIALRLTDTPATRALWPHAFDLRLTVRFGHRLEVELAASNTGPVAFPISEALHAYLAVGDVRRIAVRGLAGVKGFDYAVQLRPITGPESLTIAAETDLVFNGTADAVTVHDPTWDRTLRVAKAGSHTTVVWNPWISNAAKMPDFGDHEWPGMLCVETVNSFTEGYTLGPGESHRLATTIEVLPRPSSQVMA